VRSSGHIEQTARQRRESIDLFACLAQRVLELVDGSLSPQCKVQTRTHDSERRAQLVGGIGQ
jgi:hypothetical protein